MSIDARLNKLMPALSVKERHAWNLTQLIPARKHAQAERAVYDSAPLVAALPRSS